MVYNQRASRPGKFPVGPGRRFPGASPPRPGVPVPVTRGESRHVPPAKDARTLVPALALVLAAFAAGAAPALASFHLIRVNEVFSNSDGTLQYVELIAIAVADNSPRRNDRTNGQLPNPNAVGPVEAVPVVLGLAAAPNPFALRTRILVGLSRGGPVALAVYDVEGRLVRELAQGELGAGSRAIEWDGRDRAGRPVAAGVYTLRLAAGDGTRSAKLTVLP